MAKVNKFIFWIPRILGIIFILFLAMFSLDVFDNSYTFWETIVGLFMHNIPALILLVVLIISWKYELVGAIIFILAGLFYIGTLLITISMDSSPQWYMLVWSLIIAGPAFLIGILLLVGWSQKKKRHK